MERHEVRLELLKQMPLKACEPKDAIAKCRQLEEYCFEGEEPTKVSEPDNEENPFGSPTPKNSKKK